MCLVQDQQVGCPPQQCVEAVATGEDAQLVRIGGHRVDELVVRDVHERGLITHERFDLVDLDAARLRPPLGDLAAPHAFGHHGAHHDHALQLQKAGDGERAERLAHAWVPLQVRPAVSFESLNSCRGALDLPRTQYRWNQSAPAPSGLSTTGRIDVEYDTLSLLE